MSVLPTPTTPLRDQMIYAMQLHRLAPITQRIYLQAVWGLATFYRPSDKVSWASNLLCVYSAKPVIPGRS